MKNKKILIISIAVLLIIGVLAVYYFVYYQPKVTAENFEKSQQRLFTNEIQAGTVEIKNLGTNSIGTIPIVTPKQ